MVYCKRNCSLIPTLWLILLKKLLSNTLSMVNIVKKNCSLIFPSMVGIIIVQHFLTSVRTVIPSHAIYLVFSIYSFVSRNIHFYPGIFISIQEYSFLSRNIHFYPGIFISIQEYSFLSRSIHFYPELFMFIKEYLFSYILFRKINFVNFC